MHVRVRQHLGQQAGGRVGTAWWVWYMSGGGKVPSCHHAHTLPTMHALMHVWGSVCACVHGGNGGWMGVWKQKKIYINMSHDVHVVCTMHAMSGLCPLNLICIY